MKFLHLRFIFPLFALTVFCLSVSNAFGLEPNQVLGDYELVGVMEMAGGLSLQKDQKYVAGFSYGAADWQEAGTWKIENDEVVLENSHFKVKNSLIHSPFLPGGTRFKYQEGKLLGTDPARKLVFRNPNKTPTPKGQGPEAAGEGRMRVHGTVMKLDADILIIKTSECMQFDVKTLSDSILSKVKGKVGRVVDVEIPYSSIIGGGSC